MAISSCLVDSNVLLRLALRDSPDHRVVRTAVASLQSGNAQLFFTHQNISEFWNVATRPKEQNGFGLSVDEVEREVKGIERGLTFLPDSEALYREWRRVVTAYQVRGLQVHDARLAAAMLVHNVPHILTLNVEDFKRYQGITAVHPNTV